MKIAERYAPGAPDAGAPKVSVAITTWRHEPFIGETLDGVLMQDTEFAVEIVIGEDCSPDRTRKIILDYMAAFPGLIRLRSYERNIGSARNTMLTIGRCRGEYVALLDGDDYWTSPNKLRLQTGFLDSDPRFSVCCHAVIRKRGDRVVEIVRPTGRKSVYRLADLARWINVMPLSVVYRRSALPHFPAWFAKARFGDWAMEVLLAERGYIAYLPWIMGVHRLHDSNFWCSEGRKRSEAICLQIKQADLLIEHLGDMRAAPFVRAQRRRYHELVHAFLDEGEPVKAREVLQKIGPGRGFDLELSAFERCLIRVHMSAPGVYRRLQPHLHRLLHPWGLIVRPAFDRLRYRMGLLGPAARQG